MTTQRDELFWSHVDKSERCWIWTASLTEKGYGKFNIRVNGKNSIVKAHRHSYQLAHGEIPRNKMLDHECHRPACVNPKHLRLATNKQNQENLTGARRDNQSSGIRGVTWDKRRRKWRAQVTHNAKNHYLGLFESLELAGEAARIKRNELFTHNDADRTLALPVTVLYEPQP